MILRFRHRGWSGCIVGATQAGSRRSTSGDCVRCWPHSETALVPSDMALPGARLHPLHGDREGQWSVSLSGNWRVVFEFEGQNVTDVDLIDYH